jgi:excinuclease ABC subunit A
MDVIKVADHLIDLGPEGGDGGGEILFEGTPEKMVGIKRSFTAKFLEDEIEVRPKTQSLKPRLVD